MTESIPASPLIPPLDRRETLVVVLLLLCQLSRKAVDPLLQRQNFGVRQQQRSLVMRL